MYRLSNVSLGTTIVLALFLVSTVSAEIPIPLGYWPFDGDTLDYSGNERHGTITGNPQFVNGAVNQSLDFNGSSDQVNIVGYQGVAGGEPWSVAAWFRTSSEGERRIMVNWGTGTGTKVEMRIHHTAPDFRVSSGSGNVTTAQAVNDGEWHHVVVTVAAGTDTVSYPGITIYIDGEEDTEPTTDGDSWNIAPNVDLAIGWRSTNNDRYWQGNIDEVILYGSQLTAEEVVAVMEGFVMPRGEASQPIPKDAAVDVQRDGLTLNWGPGDSAAEHEAYFGTNFEDVINAAVGDAVHLGRQTETSYSLGRLELGQTYYWRIDEVNDQNPDSPWPGKVWSFTVEPAAIELSGDAIEATASSQNSLEEDPNNTINGSGLRGDGSHAPDAVSMWLSTASDPGTAWIQYDLDQAYKLSSMNVWNHNTLIENLVGFGIKEALIEVSLDGVDYTPQKTVELARAVQTNIDLEGTAAQSIRITAQSNWGGLFPQYGLSEVQIMTIPMRARTPQPADGAVDVTADLTLSWRAGRQAEQHVVAIGTDPNDLIPGDPLAESSLDTTDLNLSLDETYYWQVTEVNDTEAPSSWPGPLWSFSTEAVAGIDDMESYRDEAFLEIWATWVDGYNDDNNGALVGNGSTGAPEVEIVRTGGQSLPFHYDNTAGAASSEIKRSFEISRRFDGNGAQGLVLYFWGGPANTGGSLYAKVNDHKIPFDGDPSHLQRPGWTKWYIPLSDIPASDLGDVISLSIGIEGNSKGVLYVDDIVLTPAARNLVTPVEPSTENLVAHYAFEGDAADSTGQHPGTQMGEPSFEAGQVGQAIRMDGFIDYVDLVGSKGVLGPGPVTVSAWINTTAEATGTLLGWGPIVDGERFGFRINNNRIRCEIGGGNIQGFMTVNDGVWHHVAVTIQANATISYPEVKLYVDGIDDTQPTTEITASNRTAGLDARIGSRPASDDRYYEGLIDELRIYDRMLSSGEIAGMAGVTEPYDN